MPNRGFHLDLGHLERLIRFVRWRGWDIVTMDEAIRRAAAPAPRRFVTFSLDDGYRDTAEHVVPLFQRLRAPLTLFITTGIPDGTLRLQNAGLESILRTADAVTDGERHYALVTARQRRAAFTAISRRWEEAGGEENYVRFCARHGDDADRLDALHRITWCMLEGLRDLPGVEIGAHTITHRRIAALEAADAATELVGGRDRLQRVLGVAVRHFAFPYGQPADCGPRDFALARQAGFASAATTVRGLIRAGADPFTLRRNTINGNHRHPAFAQAHLSGASGLLARVRRRG